jgi:hypothetical protein
MTKLKINEPVNPCPDYNPDDEPELTMEELLDIASDLEKERDAALDLVKRYEGTDVQKAVDNFDGLANRLACETQDHNELKRKYKYKFLSDTLKKIQVTLNVDSYQDILPAIQALNEG